MYPYGWDHVGQLGAAMLCLQPVSLLYYLLQGNLQVIPISDGHQVPLPVKSQYHECKLPTLPYLCKSFLSVMVTKSPFLVRVKCYVQKLAIVT